MAGEAGLSHKHTILLTWYFGAGQSAFERSPMGSMLERAATYDNCEAYHEQRRNHNLDRREIIDDPDLPSPSSFADVPQFEAVPTAERRAAPSHEVDDKALRRYGKASRGLKRLAVVCPHGPAVMLGRYGEGSEEWAVKGFLLGGVYALTQSGRGLIKRIRHEAGNGSAKLKLEPPALLQNDFQRAVHFEDNERICEFGQAEGDARRLVSHVVSFWNDLHRGEPE